MGARQAQTRVNQPLRKTQVSGAEGAARLGEREHEDLFIIPDRPFFEHLSRNLNLPELAFWPITSYKG